MSNSNMNNPFLEESVSEQQQQQQPQQQPQDASAGTMLLPQVLTLEAISTLSISHLDASDVLEVYYLARSTKLATLDIPITKATLGLRYRPTAARPKQHELTLEFGARRTTTNDNTETIPSRNNVDGSLSWDNSAKIYYREWIDTTMFKSAHYLASISGTVVNKLLLSAVEFANRNQRRYQPWTVVLSSDTSNITTEQQPSPGPAKVLLKSMRDTDFVQYCLEILASAGVELRPVIIPLETSLVLHTAGSIHKVPDGKDAVEFYSRLYDCLYSIAKADYTKYDKKDDKNDIGISNTPTVVPSALTATTTTTPTITPSAVRPFSTPTTAAPTVDMFRKHHHHRRRRFFVLVDDDFQDDNHHHQEEDVATKQPWMDRPSPDTDLSPSLAPSSLSDTEEDALAIQQAAAAQQAAAQRAQAEAQQAAAQMAQAALLSNDATAAANIIRTCFTNERFGIIGPTTIPSNALVEETTNNNHNDNNNTNETTERSPTTKTTTTTTIPSYIYLDGSVWYQVDLIPPYISVATKSMIIPEPPNYPKGAEDFVDYVILLLLIAAAIFGALLLLQQVFGRSISLSLYRYQRWFFHPTKYSLEDDNMDFSDRRPLFSYSFGQDVIPLSMGGQLRLRNGSEHSLSDHHSCSFIMDDNGELELIEAPTTTTTTTTTIAASIKRTVSPVPPTTTTTTFGRTMSFPLETDNDLAPNRLFRDPSLVDLPNLSTLNTKIAIPVSGNNK